MTKSESYLVCEGFNDRAFIAGALTFLGCINPIEGRARKPVYDPWGQRVAGGQFMFRSPMQRFIRIVPAGGKNGVLDRAEDRLDGRNTEKLDSLWIILDQDRFVSNGDLNVGAVTLQGIQDRLVRRGFSPSNPDSTMYTIGPPDACEVKVVQWQCADESSDLLPDLQCLERLVIGSVIAAYPDRAEPVRRWLKSRPQPPSFCSPKEYSWSHMAGWYADAGCDEFFQLL